MPRLRPGTVRKSAPKKAAPKRPPKPRRARGSGSIYPNKRRGGWSGKVPVGQYANGRTRYVEVWAETQAGVIELMRGVAPPGPDVTVAAWADRWVRESGAQVQTRDDYRHTVERFIKPALGSRRVRDLTAADVENAVRSWRLGPNTARKNLRQIVTMLEAARRAKIVTENVARDARGPRAKRVKIEIFAPADLARIVAAAARRLPDTIFGLLGSVGCRMGEALALDVSDYDPATGALSITKTYSRKHGTRRPKSENGIRTVTVPGPARAAVLLAIGGRTSGPLFPTERGGGRRQHNTVRANWGVFLRKLGLTYRSPHQLRHSCCSLLISRGAPIADVAKFLGDSATTIVQTYIHPVGANLTEIIERALAATKSSDAGS